MNRHSEYQAWITLRKQVEIRPEFSNSLMMQVHQYKQSRIKVCFSSERFFTWLSTRRLAKAGLIVAAAAIGLIRFLVIVYRVFA